MDIKSIADFTQDSSIRPEFVTAWLDAFRHTSGASPSDRFALTELQQVVANSEEAKKLDGGNLIIAGPTSAGKTLAAEFIMARLLTAARPPYGCVYAVPLRVLATEKWERFKRAFGDEGVYVSSGDYQDQDAFILHRRFRIAVVVYEKLYSWLLQSNARNAILKNLGLLIVDELQMIGDIQRGPRFELLLTLVRQLQTESNVKLRIIGMGPSVEALSPIADWLDAKLLAPATDLRPVPLVQGYVCPGRPFVFVSRDPRLPNSKVVVPVVHATTRDAMLRELVVGLLRKDGKTHPVGRGKRLLVYSPSKDTAERIAEALADSLGIRQALDSATDQAMDALERTHAADRLRKTIACGVGFHHGDLIFEERRLVEQLFRAEPPDTCLDVVVCTPTLAMGVNLPADYMIFTSSETYKPKDWDERGNLPTPMTPLEYRNFAGRAGRYRPNAPSDHHGVALFISERSEEETKREIAEPIILGKVEHVSSELHRWPFGLEPLALAAAESVSWRKVTSISEASVKNVFKKTYAGKSRVTINSEAGPKAIEDVVIPKLRDLAGKHEELINGDFQVGKTGNVVAKAGIAIPTYEAMKRIAERVNDGILDSPLVILEELAVVPEIVKLYPTSLSDTPKAQADITRALRSFYASLEESGQILGARTKRMIGQTFVPDRSTLETLMRVAAIWLWIEGSTAAKIGSQRMLPGIRYGACNLLGDQLHWLVSTLPDLWDALGLSQDVDESVASDRRWDMGRFERRLRFGVPDALVSIAQLRVPGLHRENMMDLWERVAKYRGRQNGWEHPVELLGVPTKAAGPRRSLLKTLQRTILGRAWFDDPRKPWQKQIDVARMACEGDGKRNDRDWPRVLGEMWSKVIHNELVELFAYALTLKPLQLTVVSGNKDKANRFFIQDAGRYVLVDVVGDGTSVSWERILPLWSSESPKGTQVDGVLILANGSIDDIDENLSRYGKPIKVITPEAFGHLAIQVLMAPDERLPDSAPQPTPSSIVEVVRAWLCVSGGGTLGSAAAADKMLKHSSIDDQFVDSRWVQGRSALTKPRAATVMAVETMQERVQKERKIAILSQEIDRLKLTGVSADMEDFLDNLCEELHHQIERIDSEPTSVVGYIRTSIEALAKHVLTDHAEQVPGKLVQMFEVIQTKSLMRINWVNFATSLIRPLANLALHVENKVDETGRFTTTSYVSREAWDLLSITVRLWEEYLQNRPTGPLTRV